MKQLALAAVAATFMIAQVHAQTGAPADPPGGFVTQHTSDRLASRLIGLNIKNPADETIGEIYDVVLTDANSIRAYMRRGISRHWDAVCCRQSQSDYVQSTGRKELDGHDECEQGPAEGRARIQVAV